MKVNVNVLQSILSEKGISQNQLAKELKISKSTLSRIISGERNAGREVANKFIAYFGPDLAMKLLGTSK